MPLLQHREVNDHALFPAPEWVSCSRGLLSKTCPSGELLCAFGSGECRRRETGRAFCRQHVAPGQWDTDLQSPYFGSGNLKAWDRI